MLIAIITLLLSSASATSLTTKQYIETVAEDAALRHNIDPLIVKAIIHVESSYNPDAVGGIGEVGLMQLRPEYHDCATFDVVGNIECGVSYLAYVKQRCLADYGRAWLVCYNHGPNKRIKAPEKAAYFRKVLEVLNRG